MNQLAFDLTNRPAPYRRHSPTSKAAAKAVEPRTGTQRAIILAFLRGRGTDGATDEEMQLLIPLAANTQRPRRGSLLGEGFIADSGMKRDTSSKSPAVVWVAAEFKAAKPLFCVGTFGQDAASVKESSGVELVKAGE